MDSVDDGGASYLKTILLNSFPIENSNFAALIETITKFEVAYDGFDGQPFSDDELAEMDLYKDVIGNIKVKLEEE